MKTAYTISAIGHAAVLLWGVWSLARRSRARRRSTEVAAGRLVSGNRVLPAHRRRQERAQAETPKPLAEKVGEPKPVEDPTAKVVEKKEVKPRAEARRRRRSAKPAEARSRRAKARPRPPSPIRSPTR